MKKTIFFAFNALMMIGLNAQSISKTMLRLPDTGETSSYTNTFGEDSDFTINPPFFVNQGNGTVIDTVTSLMWQQTDGGEMTIENAELYCDSLTLGGYTDWRLPNAHESFSILNHQNTNPAINTTFFTTTAAQYWWTSDRQANDNNKIWCTNAGGGIGNHPKIETISAGGTKTFHVRAVRDMYVPQMLPNHFTDNGDGTITDNLTLLIWQKMPYSDTLTWEQALHYADTLSLANQNDWRLPNIKELQSLNDESLINPSLNTNYFTVAGAKKYWSSTSLPNQTTKAWYLNTQFGITTYSEKTWKHELMCVRGAGNIATELAEDIVYQAFAYPNPFSNHINIQNSKGAETCELRNAMGQIIYRGKAIAQQDFSYLPNGVYFLQIIDKKVANFRLVK